MLSEKYSLSWDTYSDHLKDMVKEMIRNDDFADVTLVSEDRKHIKAHKNILSACSPVFRDIVKINQNVAPIIYLRGIYFSELESIIQFIYLGEATFYKERMNEFIIVAKSLEIKNIWSAATEIKDEDEPTLINPVAFTDNSAEENMRSTHVMNKASGENENRRREERVKGKYECENCHEVYAGQAALWHHRQSAHEGVSYACNQCDYQTTQQIPLKIHIETKLDLSVLSPVRDLGYGILVGGSQKEFSHQDNVPLHPLHPLITFIMIMFVFSGRKVNYSSLDNLEYL